MGYTHNFVKLPLHLFKLDLPAAVLVTLLHERFRSRRDDRLRNNEQRYYNYLYIVKAAALRCIPARTYRRHLCKLADAGLIDIVRKGGNSPTRFMLYDDSAVQHGQIEEEVLFNQQLLSSSTVGSILIYGILKFLCWSSHNNSSRRSTSHSIEQIAKLANMSKSQVCRHLKTLTDAEMLFSSGRVNKNGDQISSLRRVRPIGYMLHLEQKNA